jgi:hypothetical protein
MIFCDEERQAVRDFAADPAAQVELRPFIRDQGSEFGRALTTVVLQKFSTAQLLKNSLSF